MNKCHADNGISLHCTLCYGWQWVMFGLQAALWCVLRYPPTTMEMLTHPTNNWILLADAFINLWCVQCFTIPCDEYKTLNWKRPGSVIAGRHTSCSTTVTLLQRPPKLPTKLIQQKVHPKMHHLLSQVWDWREINHFWHKSAIGDPTTGLNHLSSHS